MDLRPILWNMVLAVIPALLGPLVAAGLDRKKWWVVPAFLVWVAFLPNSAYLLAGRHHFFWLTPEGEFGGSFLEVRRGVAFFPLRTLAFMVYGGFGLLTFTLAVRPVASALRRRGWIPALLAPLLFTLVSQGVYLGRTIRLNSWDLVLDPGRVLLIEVALWLNLPLLTLTVGLGCLLWIGYVLTDLCLLGFTTRYGAAVRTFFVRFRHDRKLPAPARLQNSRMTAEIRECDASTP